MRRGEVLRHEQVRQVWEQLQRRAHDRHATAPRVLFVYAHPDDEAIAVGGNLPLFHDALFLQVTDGAPADNTDGTRLGLSRDAYRATRTLEVRAAFAAGGLPEARHRALNLPDKEAAFHLHAITRQIAAAIHEVQPGVIFTHPYEGGHADHDACAFAVHTAVRELGGDRPLIVESPFYFANADGTMHTGNFLHEDNSSLDLPLTPAQQERKRNAFAAFATQREILDLFAPALQQERFRIAPAYDFSTPACTGATFYESFIPNLNAVRFAQLASEALERLQPELVR